MISVEEATQIVLDSAPELGTEAIELDDATGRVLAQDLVADRDFPPYDRVTMDGIAIDYEQYRQGRRAFAVRGIAPAGTSQQTLTDPEGCIEVMTGTMLPVNTSCVVRYEDLDIQHGMATVKDIDLTHWQNIHTRGSDSRAGVPIVRQGSILGFGEVGVAATVGISQVNVIRQPSVCIISTGDEIVPINERPLPHQIRSSNVHVIKHLLGRIGIKADNLHLPDDAQVIDETLTPILIDYDVVILSGGVSKGKFDFVPSVLENQGVRKLFHRITQRPGKPFWYGVSDDTFVFALPGNPVSACMCCVRYVLPWFRKAQGIPEREKFVRLAENVHFKPDLTLFQQSGVVFTEDGSLLATPIKGNGSGDLTSLVGADGFAELPRGRDDFSKGEVFRWWSL